mgnify:CR=1 FL=1
MRFGSVPEEGKEGTRLTITTQEKEVVIDVQIKRVRDVLWGAYTFGSVPFIREGAVSIVGYLGPAYGHYTYNVIRDTKDFEGMWTSAVMVKHPTPPTPKSQVEGYLSLALRKVYHRIYVCNEGTS